MDRSHRTSLVAPLLLGALLSAPLSALSSSAQEPAPRTTEKPRPTRLAEERGVKTLLHTADGRILRMRARQVDGVWQVKEKKGWRDLPASYVVRAVPERDALKESRRLAKELGRKSPPTRRVAYADWLLGEGLFPEAMKELDRVFDESPNESSALALLKRRDIPIRLGDPSTDLEAFFKRAAQASPSGREVAAIQLAEAFGRGVLPGLAEVLEKDLVQKLPSRRGFAALALRRLFPGSATKPLLYRSLIDASEDVRRQSSLALGAIGDPAVAVPALNCLAHDHPKVRLYAAEALGDMGYPETVEPMISFLGSAQSASGGRPPHQHIFIGKQFAYVQDFDVEVAQFASIADPVINVGQEGAVLDVAVISTSTVTTQLAGVRRSLAKITGFEGRSNRAWKKWWAENESTWNKGADEPESGPSTPAR